MSGTTELAQISGLKRALALAKTPEDVANVWQLSASVAGALRRVCSQSKKSDSPERYRKARDGTCEAVAVMDAATLRLGEWVGPPPGVGQVRSGRSITSEWSDVIDKHQVLEIRRLTYRCDPECRKGYREWFRNHTDKVARYQDILVLARVDEDDQPAVITQLTTGKADTLAEAIRNVKRDKIKTGGIIVPEGTFRTVIVDPPWPIKKIERETAPNQGQSLDYPTMSLEEIAAFDIPAYEDAHCYLWTTQRFLPYAFEILEGWDFTYVFTMVWHKAGGFQPVNLPQYNCEFVLFGRRGGLGFLDTKDFMVCFDGKRREHGRKPEGFYDVVRRVSPGPRCDVFSREKVDGFEQGGNQLDAFDVS